MRREQVAQVTLKRLGTDKMQALVSMKESFGAQLQEKRELLETTRKRAGQTRDDELAQQFIQYAEKINAHIHILEKEYDDAREMLEDFHAGNAWIQSTLKRIYEHDPVRDMPKPEDVKAFPYEERRLLLAATGLRVEIFPATRQPRAEVYFSWELSPI
jgi:hypothetical protein